MKRCVWVLLLAAAVAASAQTPAYIPANGATSTGSGPANVIKFPGTVAAATSVSGPNVPVPVLCPPSPADCSSAITMAIGSLPSGGGSIWIPPGSTIASNILSGLTKPVTFQFFNGTVTFTATQILTGNNIVFQGQSKTATVFQCSGNQICFELGNNSGTNYQYITFKDLLVTGDGQTSGHTSQVLLDLNGVNHTTIQNVRMDQSGGDGIDLDAHTSPTFNAYMHIQNSEIWLNGGIGINDTGSNSAEMSLVGTSIADNTSDAIRWNSYQFSMEGGSVENNGGRVWLGTKQYDRQGCSIHGVYFEGNIEDIRIGSANTLPTPNATYEGCDISGNRFNGANGSGVQTSPYALNVQAGNAINFHGNWSYNHSGSTVVASTVTNPSINLGANYSSSETYLSGSQTNIAVASTSLSSAPSTGCVAYVDVNGIQQPCTTLQPTAIASPSNELSMVDVSGLGGAGLRQNLVTYSAAFDNAAWIKTLLSVTTGAANGPDGSVNTADQLTITSGSANYLLQTYNTGSAVGARTFTGSVFARSISGTATIQIRISDGSDGFGSLSPVVTLTTGWKRINLTWTFPADTNTMVTFAPYYVISPTSSVIIWGAQLCESPNPCPKVATTSTPVTSTELVWTAATASAGTNTTQLATTEFVQAAVPHQYSISWTPAAATASSCAEQTVTVTGVATTKELGVNPPATTGVHVWVGSVRASAANTAAVSFCADATGGTPPNGTWLFEQ